MTDFELHERLDALGKKIETRRAEMVRNATLFKAEQRLTGEQLDERSRSLKQRLDRDVADEEAHGHHVGDFEKSVRTWFADMDVDI